MVTDVPAGPEAGQILVMPGGTSTVKGVPALDCPTTVTTTFPAPAPLGTMAAMLLSDQLAATPADTPLNVTVLSPGSHRSLRP
jgi:hypothetical protein